MAIKTSRKSTSGKAIYKSSKQIITEQEKLIADRDYIELETIIKNTIKDLQEKGVLTEDAKKRDALAVWYEIGKKLDQYLIQKKMDKEDENLFWQTLYGRWPSIHSNIPQFKVDSTRNDFKTARELAKFDFNVLKKVGSWGFWREVIDYKRIYSDFRIIDWIVVEFSKHPKTRDESRPVLKKIANRFKRIDTNELTKKELYDKLSQIDLDT